MRRDTQPVDFLEETACFHLKNAVDSIEMGDGLVANLDYDEDVEYHVEPSMYNPVPDGTKAITVEVTYLLSI